MSLRLHTHGRIERRVGKTVLGRITFRPTELNSRADYIRVLKTFDRESDLEGYAGVLTQSDVSTEQRSRIESGCLQLVDRVAHLDHLCEGDVVAINPNGYVRTLYRIESQHNAIFATDRCNSFCLMCSQPPKPVDDSDRIDEHLRLVELIDPSCRELGITGGEPSLLKDDLLRIIRHCQSYLPDTAIHILTNGRLFYYDSFARKLGALGHPDLVLGIPLYSDLDYDHDFVVQSKGAFHETVIGLQNLGRHGVAVEIRIVIHLLTFARLAQLAEFIYRNFPFAVHVALMGLELMGFAVPNFSQLWIDPFDYRRQLREATVFLASRGMNVSIYNHQLCIVPSELWQYCQRSISDWKNEFLESCDGCAERGNCGGFFSSNVKRAVSRHIAPL